MCYFSFNVFIKKNPEGEKIISSVINIFREILAVF